MIVDIQIEQIDFNVDPKQISDVLDFIKFQSYTIVYGNILISFLNIHFIYLKDRCREYRKLLLQDYLDNTSLTKEQRQRIEVIFILINTGRLYYSCFRKVS